MSNYILDVTGDDFNEAVLNNSHKGPVMVNYWAENAVPCLRVNSVPTVKLFINGEVLDQIHG